MKELQLTILENHVIRDCCIILSRGNQPVKSTMIRGDQKEIRGAIGSLVKKGILNVSQNGTISFIESSVALYIPIHYKPRPLNY